MKPEISFIVVTYQNEQTIEACLDSIRKWTAQPFEIIVVDNSPEPDTARKVEAFWAQTPELHTTLIRPSRNLGFGRGCNVGAVEARGEFLFFLNPDTRLENDVAGLLSGFLRKTPGAVLAGPQILEADGAVCRTCRNLPTWWRIFLDASGVDKYVGAYRLLRFDHLSPCQVGQVIGAAFFMSRRTFEQSGGFDERFFMYFEEVDFCKRLHDSDGEIWFRPEAMVVHQAGTSAESLRNVERMIVALRHSRRLYFEKHSPGPSARLVVLINRLEGLGRGVFYGVRYLLRRKPSDKARARGYFKVLTC